MKNFIKLCFFTVVLISFSCTNSEKNQQEKNMQLVEQLFTHFNNHEWEKMAGLYVDSAEFKDPSFGNKTVRQSQNQIVKKYSELHQMFPDIQDKVFKMYPSGKQTIIVEFISSGNSIEGDKLSLPICSILTIENGKFVKDYNYYDDF